MIRARRLFLVPALSMFFLMIPIIGIVITMLTLWMWYFRNESEIKLYFKGYKYRLNEMSKEEIDNDKLM